MTTGLLLIFALLVSLSLLAILIVTLAIYYRTSARAAQTITLLKEQKATLEEAMQKRLERVYGAVEIGLTAASVLNLSEQLPQTLNLILERLGYFHASVFLVDAGDEYAIIRESSGEIGQRLKHNAQSFRIASSQAAVAFAIANSKSHVVRLVEDKRGALALSQVNGSQAEAVTPLIIGDRTLGALDVHSRDAEAFSPAEMTLLQTLANQLAIAIDNANVFAQQKEHLTENERLLKASQQSIDDLYSLAGRLTSDGWKKYLAPQHHELNVESGGSASPGVDVVGQVDNLPYVGVENGGSASPGVDVVGQVDNLPYVASTGVDEVINNAFKKRGMVVSDSNTGSSLAAPIILRGQVIGALALEKSQDDVWSEDDRVLAQEVADRLALAVDNARLVDQINRERERVSVLFKASQELSATLDLPKTIRTLLNFAPRLGADYAFLILVDGTTRALYRYYSTIPGLDRLTEKEEKELIDVLMTDGTERWVMENRRTALIKDANTDERWHQREIKGKLPIRSAVAIPLHMPSGTIAGILGYVHTLPNRFTEDHLPMFDSIATQAYVALQNAQLYSQVRVQQRNANTLAVSTQRMSRMLNEKELWQTLADSLFNAFQPNGVVIFKFDATAETLNPILLTIASGDADTWPVTDQDFPAIKRPDLAEVMSSRSARITTIRHEPPDQVRESIALPFIFGETLEGVVEVVHTGAAHGISLDDMTLFQSLLASTAYALQTARLYEQLSQTAERLREVDRLKSQFLANMSHELRTPLNSIIGFSRVIMKGIDGPVSDLQVQDLAAINNAGNHLLGMINDILDHAKIEAGKMELAFEKMDLSEIIKSVMSTTGGLIKDKPVRLVPDLQVDLPPVYVDGIRVRQVLINLFSNAAKFTDQGTITVRAVLQEFDTRSMVEVSVRDTGQGIAQADLSKLFQAFTQVDGSATRRTDGTGLGLAISRNLVELHGGTIWVESVVGEGTTFFFTLPVYQPAPALPHVEPGDNRRIILAIDDDARVIDLYRRYAEPHGYAVHGITNNLQAAESAQLLKPFVILLDVLMQERNGWQVLQELKQNNATQDFPVIICSILNEREKALSMGAADCLIKRNTA